VPTGFCIALLGFALTLINFGLDAVTNPKLAHPQRVGPTPVDFGGKAMTVKR
jgi:hypothetical protein